MIKGGPYFPIDILQNNYYSGPNSLGGLNFREFMIVTRLCKEIPSVLPAVNLSMTSAYTKRTYVLTISTRCKTFSYSFIKYIRKCLVP